MTESPAVPDPRRSTGSRIAVLDKAVNTLDALLTARNGLTPTEVARAINTNRSTAFRLLVSLEQTGLLSRDPSTGKYRLGMKMLQYGAAVRLSMDIIEIAEPVLLNLRDETRQTTLLAVREGWSARCIMRLPGLEVDVPYWTSGRSLPLHGDAAPQAIMSALSEGEVEQYFQHSDEWRARNDDCTVEDVRESLDETRRRGWALNSTTVAPGVVSLATAVLDPTGSTVYAISVSGLERHYTGRELERTATKVAAAARDIAGQLSR